MNVTEILRIASEIWPYIVKQRGFDYSLGIYTSTDSSRYIAIPGSAMEEIRTSADPKETAKRIYRKGFSNEIDH